MSCIPCLAKTTATLALMNAGNNTYQKQHPITSTLSSSQPPSRIVPTPWISNGDKRYVQMLTPVKQYNGPANFVQPPVQFGIPIRDAIRKSGNKVTSRVIRFPYDRAHTP